MSTEPLAARMRPRTLDDVLGQDELIIEGSPLRSTVEGKLQSSILLWGTPGSGKTTIAHVIGNSTDKHFVELSATSATVKDVRKVFDDARKAREDHGTSTILFLDEIHRFTKSQQDILLPAVEDGTIALIGATTENPSFSVISALQSRSLLLVLKPLGIDDIIKLLGRAIDDPRGLDGAVTASYAVLEQIAQLVDGDTRQALNRLELAAQLIEAAGESEITAETVDKISGRATLRYDKNGDQHYDIISAFIKSMRGSDPDAAVHYMARMLESGEDPRYLARRMMIHASEDVGMADPQALLVATAAAQAVALVGMPEAQIILAQAAVHIATAPKSKAIVNAIHEAMDDVKDGNFSEVPIHLRDSHYPGAKKYGHGVEYQFPLNDPFGVVAQQYPPDALVGRDYYLPQGHGNEEAIAKRLKILRSITRSTGEDR